MTLEDDTDHRMRLVPHDTPQVYAVDGAVILQCTPEHAEILADLLATTAPDLARELRTVKARTEIRLVPFLPPTPRVDS